MNWLRSRPTPPVEPTPIPPLTMLRTFRCPEPGCPVSDRDVAVVFAHAISQHAKPKTAA